MRIPLALTLLSALPSALLAQADATDYDPDLLVLAPEKRLEVRILRVGRKDLTYLDGSREVTVPRDRVAHWERSLDLSEAFLERAHLAEQARNVEALCKLAEWCEERRMRKFARNAWLGVLLIDPQHDAANRALGHVESANGWLVPFERTALPFAEVCERRRDWNHAWELQSLHYDLRTDAPLPRALQLLRDLEWFYVTFFTCFGVDLRLDDRPERLVVHVHEDHADAPKLSGTVAAFFDPQARALFTGFAGGDTSGFPVALDHEASHQVFFHTMRFRATGGGIPGWLDEGLAEYFRSIIRRGAPGSRPDVLPARREPEYFAAAAAGREYRLERLLTMQSDDFAASSNQREKYAHAYAWVHYLLLGAEGAWRSKFIEFVRAAYTGKGTSSTFKKIMGSDFERMKKGYEPYLEVR
jgi:hypothetical protein